MIEVRQTNSFRVWVEALDIEASARILSRLDRVAAGNFGDTKSVGGGVSELRVNWGPGYRLYYTRQGKTVILLLCGGDKGSQSRDVRKAQQMLMELKG